MYLNISMLLDRGFFGTPFAFAKGQKQKKTKGGTK
jgi:hypothetical protein